MSKKWKYILITLTGFILLVVSLLLFTQTSFFREKVKERLIILVENQLTFRLEIEELDGDFYSYIAARNISFKENDTTVASFGALKVDFELLPLFKNIISIDSIVVENPQIVLQQKNDSTWNVNTLVKPKKDKSTKKRGAFLFEILVKHFAIREGSISVSSSSAVIPTNISGINLEANGAYRKMDTRISLDKFEFKTKNPSFELKNLSGIYRMNGEGIQLDSLLLVTTNSTIDFDAEYISEENLKAKINNGRIDKNELAVFIPTFRLLCSPSIKASFNTLNDSVSASAELQYQNQSVSADISFKTLSNLRTKTEPVPYFAQFAFTNFQLNDWIESKDQRGLINGNFQVDGENILNFNSLATITGHLENSKYNDILIDTLLLSGVYEADSITAHIKAITDFGDVKITAGLNNSELPTYNARLECIDINMNVFVSELIGTKINGIVEAEGEGLNAQDLKVDAKINLHNSSVYKFPIDSLKASLNLQKKELNIDSLLVYAPGAFVAGSGYLDLDSLILESTVYGDIKSVEVLDSFVVLPIQFDSATTVTTIRGPVRTLGIGGEVDVSRAKGYASSLESAKAKYLVLVRQDSLNVWVNTIAQKVEIGPSDWDAAVVDFNYTEEYMDIVANVNWEDKVRAQIDSRISIGDTMSVDISNFEMQTILANFYMPDTMRARIYNYGKLELENLKLKDHKKEDFNVVIGGNISTSDSNNFNILVEHFDLSQLNRFIGKEDSLKGYFATDIALSGSSEHPIISGKVCVENSEFGQYALTSLESKFGYADENGFAELRIPDMGNSFLASFNAQFKAYFDSLIFVFDPPKEYNGSLVFDALDISKTFTSLMPNDSLKGVLNGKIEAIGEFDNPLFYGALRLNNGQYINEKLGVEYNDIETSISFDGNKMSFDTVLVRQKDGLISVAGEMEFDSTIIKGNITSSSLQIDADKFFVTKHRNYELLIDANTFVKSSNQKPEFGGEIKVIRSDLFLPALLSENKTDAEKDVPLLVEAIQSTGDSASLEVIAESIQGKTERRKNRVSDQLTGRLKVEIPRNTWIRSNDMRLELSGDLEIVKTGPYFELFGNIDVLRGQYILYGRKLNITESQIIFQGGEELDPNLNIEAEYVYRGSDKEKRYLELMISGTVSEPEITFVLDGTEITETDGVSILIFGATSDEIGYGGQNGIIGSMGSNAVASLVSSQLSRTIGSQFNLDMIEITTTENWQTAAFVVGKYITNDIFVIYERGFGEVDGDEITPETITVEYEINDKLFLRLQSGSSKESGMDVILKFEQGDKISGLKKK